MDQITVTNDNGVVLGNLNWIESKQDFEIVGTTSALQDVLKEVITSFAITGSRRDFFLGIPKYTQRYSRMIFSGVHPKREIPNAE